MSIPPRHAEAVDPWLVAAAAMQVAAWIVVSMLGRTYHADPLWRRATARLRLLLLATATAGTLLAALGLPSVGALVMGLVPGLLGLLVLFLGMRHLQRHLDDRASP